MNIQALLAFVISTGIMATGLILSSDDVMIFIDPVSAFIVVGGTFGATAIAFQLSRLGMLFKIFMNRMLKGKKFDYTVIVKEVMQAGDRYRKGESLKVISDDMTDFFLKEGLVMLDDGILAQPQALAVMKKRNNQIFSNNMDDASKMKAVGKFPPAFGMIGTTIGMIVLLANLGGADAMKKIGPAMGVCLITTLYGAAIANMIFVPIGENLTEGSKEIFLKNQIILEGLPLIVAKENPIVIAERLNSYLSPGQRLDWKEMLGKDSGGE
jgi:chemotaxis protein MotA